MGDSFRNALDNVVAFLPKLLLFLIILAIGYFIAKALERLLVKVLEKVGFDGAVERGGIKKALQNSQYDASQILAKIVFYAVMLFVLSTAFGVFGTNPISDYLSAIIGYLPKVFVAILILVIAAAVAAGVKLLVQNSLGSLSYGRLLANVASTVVLALGVIAALNQLEIAQNVVNAVLYATLAALVGVVVVAVGGGGIVPMRARWENALTKVEAEAPNMRREAQSARPAGQAVREAAQEYRPQGQSSSGQQAGPPPSQQYGQQSGQQFRQPSVGATAAGGQHTSQPGTSQQPAAHPYDQEQGGWAPAQQQGATSTPDAGPQSGRQQGEWAPAHQYGEQQYGSPQQYTGQQGGQSSGDQPQWAPAHQYGEQEYGDQQHGDEQYGDQQHGDQQQYGQPQAYSTEAIPVPDPQQAYEQPPVPGRRDEDPGTQQLPRVTGYDEGEQQR